MALGKAMAAGEHVAVGRHVYGYRMHVEEWRACYSLPFLEVSDWGNVRFKSSKQHLPQHFEQG